MKQQNRLAQNQESVRLLRNLHVVFSFKFKSWCPELRTYFAFLTKQLLRLTGPSRRAPLSPDFAGSHVPREPKHPRAEPVARGRAAEPVGFRWNSDPENGSGKMRDRQPRWANVRPPNGGEKNTEKATLGWLTLFQLREVCWKKGIHLRISKCQGLAALGRIL